MDTDVKKAFDRQAEVLEENNKMLRRLNRVQTLHTLFWTLKWVVIIGAALGLYYKFQPTILQLFELYDRLLVDASSLNEGVTEAIKSLAPGR